MKSTTQGFRFIALTVISILVLTIVGATFLSPAYAPSFSGTFTLIISPNPALPGESVTFSGAVMPPFSSTMPFDSMLVIVYSSVSCGPIGDIGFIPLTVNLAPSTITAQTFPGTANGAGDYSITVPGGFSAGSYSVRVRDDSYSGVVDTACDPFTVGPPIPEYPLGLPILAIFMIIGYGVIRRRTRIP